ncbi:MAG: hypothetical protein KatS3mg112_0817 [Thermogutta sp.]|nr:MAG: hypothetical protein KatS3mg112_0817 [Thermogutta sp.]
MNDPQRVLARWSHLPNPREEADNQTLTAVFCENVWHHCLKHWVCQDEPWKEEFGADVVAQLRNNVDLSSAKGRSIIDVVLGGLKKQTQESFVRPQVLIFRRRLSIGNHTNWLLILPSGAIAILRETGQFLRWITCYYLAPVAVVKKRRERWKTAVRQIIRRYVPLKGEPPQWLLPSQEEEVAIRNSEGKVIGWVKNLQFITPENWGFEPELKGCPWRGRLPSWPAAEEAESPTYATPRPRWLKPRRWREDNADAYGVQMH